MKGAKNTLSLYKYLGWLLPVIKMLAPNYVSRLDELGDAMINAATKGYEKQILEVKDIAILSKEISRLELLYQGFDAIILINGKLLF